MPALLKRAAVKVALLHSRDIVSGMRNGQSLGSPLEQRGEENAGGKPDKNAREVIAAGKAVADEQDAGGFHGLLQRYWPAHSNVDAGGCDFEMVKRCCGVS